MTRLPKFARAVALTVTVAVAATACLDSSTGPPVATNIPLESLEQQLRAKYCALLFECTGTGDTAFFKALFANTAECIANIDSIIDEPIAGSAIDAANAGTATYDGAAAAACLNTIRPDLICDDIGELGQVCPDVFTGTVAADAACNSNVECVPGHYCDRSGQVCPGACKAKLPAGTACTTDASCAFSGTKGFAQCEVSTGTCVNLETGGNVAAAGMVCGRVGTAPNFTLTACAPGQFCKTSSGSTEGTCATLIALNQPCGSGDQCAGLWFCVGSLCREILVATTVGAACGESNLTVCDPFERLGCTDETLGTCVAGGNGTAGAQCGSFQFDSLECNTGLYCDGTTDVCTVKQADGQSCSGEGQECVSGKCENNVCTARNVCGD